MPCHRFTQGNIIKSIDLVLALKCMFQRGGGVNRTLRETGTDFKKAPLLFLIKAKREKKPIHTSERSHEVLVHVLPFDLHGSPLTPLLNLCPRGNERKTHSPPLIMSSCYTRSSLIHATRKKHCKLVCGEGSLNLESLKKTFLMT